MLDDRLTEAMVAHARYVAAHLGLELAVAGVWALEGLVRDAIRAAGPRVHEDAALRRALVAWLEAGLGRAAALRAEVRLGAAGRDVIGTAFRTTASPSGAFRPPGGAP